MLALPQVPSHCGVNADFKLLSRTCQFPVRDGSKLGNYFMASAHICIQNYAHSQSVSQNKTWDQSIINGTGSYSSLRQTMQAHVYGWGWIILLYIQRKGRTNTINAIYHAPIFLALFTFYSCLVIGQNR